MFDRVGSLAERVATNVSRRAFLGRLGQGALALGALIGGVFALPGEAQASGDLCCAVPSFSGCEFYKAVQGSCPCGGFLVDCKSLPRRCAKVPC